KSDFLKDITESINNTTDISAITLQTSDKNNSNFITPNSENNLMTNFSKAVFSTNNFSTLDNNFEYENNIEALISKTTLKNEDQFNKINNQTLHTSNQIFYNETALGSLSKNNTVTNLGSNNFFQEHQTFSLPLSTVSGIIVNNQAGSNLE